MSPHELTKWLHKNKYYVPVGAKRVFAKYVAKGWYWLVMRVRPEASKLPTLAPHPITYTYKDDKLVYPLIISQLSAYLENEIVLYVVSRHRYMSANWPNLTIKQLTDTPIKLKVDPIAPSGTNYEKLLSNATVQNSGQLFVTEYFQQHSLFGYTQTSSGEINNVLSRHLINSWGNFQSITRLRAVMTPRAMDLARRWGHLEVVEWLRTNRC